MPAISPNPRRTLRIRWKPLARSAVRVGLVYATTGMVGVGVLAWVKFRAHRAARDEAESVQQREENSSLSAAA